jgi:prepilin-type N-terminal cleavage/methylation domain-containing protein
VKKRNFSLLEIMLVLALLGVFAVWVGPKAFEKIQEHRFHHQVEEIQEKFLFLRKMAFLRQEDIFLTLAETKEGIKTVVFVEEGEKLFSGKSQEEKIFKNLFFTYQGQKNKKEGKEKKEVKRKKIQFSFFSSGMNSPLGSLSFFDSKGHVAEMDVSEFLGFSVQRKEKKSLWVKGFRKKKLSEPGGVDI